ncbi:uncharacterized protein ARMOST_15540 [Armillaria ostoyae]|uniref:DJ-1/PfpI domain-containing protein n=1 Tax=Armillaria ostoyae TaxID=47428 RepID=A0A284RTM6_ARMOS|nr:uncharacterized protein ARMOST_15540 [Armillaria ostoyae]
MTCFSAIIGNDLGVYQYFDRAQPDELLEETSTGLLDGKRATTNKEMFKVIKEDTKDLPITWIAKARWVATEDKKIWSSSGITAGMDLAYAFLEYITGKGPAEASAGFLEMMVNGEGDDPFAAKNGLV